MPGHHDLDIHDTAERRDFNTPGFAKLSVAIQHAVELQQLDLAMIGEDSRDSMFRQQIVNHLENIERMGSDLRQGDLASRHRFLLSGMTDFLNDVERARMNAEANPPRYYLAGRVSGACTSCHDTVR